MSEDKGTNPWSMLTRSDLELSPVVIQVLGIIMVVAVMIAWLFTGKVQAALLGAGGTLIGLGQYGTVLRQIRDLQNRMSGKPPEEVEDGENK